MQLLNVAEPNGSSAGCCGATTKERGDNTLTDWLTPAGISDWSTTFLLSKHPISCCHSGVSVEISYLSYASAASTLLLRVSLSMVSLGDPCTSCSCSSSLLGARMSMWP